jgi:hypothetical protein
MSWASCKSRHLRSHLGREGEGRSRWGSVETPSGVGLGAFQNRTLREKRQAGK